MTTINASADTIQKLIDLAAPTELDAGDLKYTSKPVHPLIPPMPPAVMVSTLQSIVELYQEDLDDVKTKGSVYMHVVSPTRVELVSKEADAWGRYRVYAVAEYPKSCLQFPFGQFKFPNEFIILAHVCFQRVKIENDDGTMAKDLDYVLRIASNIAACAGATSTDDGISQTVETKRGVMLKETGTLKGIVELAPYRTFAEIDQVISRFLFRAQGDEEGAMLALFEADGGRWRLDATDSISEWLVAAMNQSDEVPVVS